MTAEQLATLQMITDSLRMEIAALKQRLGKHECPSCGETDREENRFIHPVSSDPVCFICGETWD